MNIAPVVLYTGGTLTNAAATLFTAPANSKTIITAATFTNIDASLARLLTVYIVRSGGSASTANVIINGKSIALNGDYVSTELVGQVLAGGDFIQAKADAGASITVAGISGYTIS